MARRIQPPDGAVVHYDPYEFLPWLNARTWTSEWPKYRANDPADPAAMPDYADPPNLSTPHPRRRDSNLGALQASRARITPRHHNPSDRTPGTHTRRLRLLRVVDRV